LPRVEWNIATPSGAVGLDWIKLMSSLDTNSPA
jgi:hypothetical protein